MPFTNLAKSTREGLQTLADAVTDIHPTEVRTFSFRTGTLDPAVKPKALIDDVGRWARDGRFIYLFQTAAPDEQLAAMFRSYEGAKVGNLGGRKYARMFQSSQTLYVGGSKDLKARLSQHLGYGAKAVYAMQLAHWARQHDVEVEFSVARYDAATHDDVLGALEDFLWAQRRPMLGRQGRR